MWVLVRHRNMGLSFVLAGTRIEMLSLTEGPMDGAIPSHTHGSGCYEIHYIARGYGTVLLAGRRYELEPGVLYVTGPQVVHAQLPRPDEPMDECCVYLRAEPLRAPEPEEQEHGTLLARFLAQTCWLGEDVPEIEAVLRQLLDELKGRRQGYRLQIEALLRQLLVLLVRSYAGAAAEGPAPAEPGGPQMLLEEYFLYGYRTLTLPQLAGRLNLSPRQTERLLRQEFGRTFSQLRLEARMSAAALFLTQTDWQITRIADEVGYSSAEHFTAAFTRHQGQSPRQYRLSQGGLSLEPSGKK